jgi:hypothetical protein
MAKPIQPTPPLNAEDSRALLASLAGGASAAEMGARAARAQVRIAALSAPKGNAMSAGNGAPKR